MKCFFFVLSNDIYVHKTSLYYATFHIYRSFTVILRQSAFAYQGFGTAVTGVVEFQVAEIKHDHGGVVIAEVLRDYELRCRHVKVQIPALSFHLIMVQMRRYKLFFYMNRI